MPTTTMIHKEASSMTRIRSTNTKVTIEDRTLLLCEWCELYKIPVPVVIERRRSGWTWEEAITKPRRRYRSLKECDQED
jgi:hypothetical protein